MVMYYIMNNDIFRDVYTPLEHVTPASLVTTSNAIVISHNSSESSFPLHSITAAISIRVAITSCHTTIMIIINENMIPAYLCMHNKNEIVLNFILRRRKHYMFSKLCED